MLKHYVEFLYPGIITSETTLKEVQDREPRNISIPEEAFGFRFVDREEIELREEILKGEYKSQSGWYYQGRKMSLEDVKREMPEKKILIDNMIYNSFDYIVWAKFGQAIPLYENDVVI